MKVEIYIQGNRLDLYEDEGIDVKQVSQDLKDISKVYGDYSQTFNVPASKRNNIALSNWYNPEIDNGFDARTRVEGIIRLDTLDFKIGKFRLDGAVIENNKPKNYKLTFFGNVIKIKDLISEDELSDLSWLENLTYTSSGTLVKQGLTSGIDITVGSETYTDAIIFPLISYKRQYLYDSDASDTTSTEQFVNIAYDAGRSDGVDSSNLKPAVKLSLIIKAIEEEYGLLFNSPFFDSIYFDSIYVNLNKDQSSVGESSVVVEQVSGDFTPNGFNIVGCRYVADIVPQSGFQDVPYRVRMSVSGVVVYEEPTSYAGSRQSGNDDYNTFYSTPYNVRTEIISEQPFTFNITTNFSVRSYSSNTTYTQTIFNTTLTSQSTLFETNVSKLVPEVGVLDLLTNMFKIFNLVAVADGEDILIQDLQSWYTDGKIYDVTKFIDLESQSVDRGKIFRKINFKFKESEQILANEFRETNKQGYGDLEFELTNASGQVANDIDGEVLDIEAIFENPQFERLIDRNNSDSTSIQYCPYIDKDLKAIGGNMFMFYANAVNVSSNPIGFVNDGVYEQINTSVLMPSHSYNINSNSFNLNFNNEVNEYTYGVFPDTIFKRYYQDYITDMFSIKRRVYKFDGILPNYLLNQLKLNDRLVIKDRRYIINSINSNLTTRKDTLELINDIYDAPLASDTLLLGKTTGGTASSNTSLFNPSFINITNDAQTVEVQYVGVSGSNIAKLSATPDFITLDTKTTTGTVTNVKFTVTRNSTTTDRTQLIQITDNINDPKLIVYQDRNGSTFDNTDITFDDNTVTFDIT